MHKAWRLNLPGDIAERSLRVSAMAVIGLGLLLRARGFFFPAPGNSLWLDEAAWAIRLIEAPLSEHLIRPIAFMAITKALISVFGPYATLFRLLPWLAGVATTLMALPLARRLFRSEAARLFFVAIVVLSPSAIDLSKDFKPYSLGLAFHLGTLLLALRYRDSGATRDLVAACALIVPSVLFAQDAVFAYPSLFLFLGFLAWRAKRTRHLAGIGGAAVVTLGLVAGMYFLVWTKIESKSEQKYWGEKYDVFYVKKNNPEGKADWFLRHYRELTAFPGERRDLWNDRLPQKARRDLAYVDRMLWFALHIAGLTVLVRGRKYAAALLLVGPIVVMSAFNVRGLWPFGHFRTNLFVLVYLAGIAAAAVDREAQKTRLWDLLPATVMVLLPLIFFEKTWHARKEADWMAPASWFEKAAQELLAFQSVGFLGQRELLAVDHYACHSAQFYSQYNPITKKTIGKGFAEGFRMTKCLGQPKQVFREVRRALSRGDERAWMIIGSEVIIKKIDKEWPRDLERFVDMRLGEDQLLIAGVRKKPPEPASAAIN